MGKTSHLTFTAQQAVIAQAALRQALGLPIRQLSLQALIGAVSEEIGQLRGGGRTDAEIATLITEALWTEIPASAVADCRAGSAVANHQGDP